MFNIGEDVIDTVRKQVVTISAIIPSPIEDLYVVTTWVGDNSYYIVDRNSLIVYDKYYFDEV